MFVITENIMKRPVYVSNMQFNSVFNTNVKSETYVARWAI